jgi:hypothetical protein
MDESLGHKNEPSRMLSCLRAAYCSHGSLSTTVCFWQRMLLRLPGRRVMPATTGIARRPKDQPASIHPSRSRIPRKAGVRSNNSVSEVLRPTTQWEFGKHDTGSGARACWRLPMNGKNGSAGHLYELIRVCVLMQQHRDFILTQKAKTPAGQLMPTLQARSHPS